MSAAAVAAPAVSPAKSVDNGTALTQARAGFKTQLQWAGEPQPPLPVPPKGVFNLVRFDAPVGKLAAYVTPDPRDGKKHPAIVWITGGDSNSGERNVGTETTLQRPVGFPLPQGRRGDHVPVAAWRER
ncbi:hypothetical protein LP419_00900 [Massilia sp. H-1]|nr:hypothetical protein LP419_00900 [Massilia sp. H-1]